MTTPPVKSLIDEQVCETCQGGGKIDQRIGGHAFSGIADCPDCNGCGAVPPITELRCEGCGYMTHHREHMGCVSAAKLGRPSLRELRMLDALEYALPYLEACIPNPRNGVNHDGSVDLNAVQRVRDAIVSCRAALAAHEARHD